MCLISRDYISNEISALRNRLLHYWGFQQHLMANCFQDSGFFWKSLRLYIFICTHRNRFKISLSVFTTHRTAELYNFSSFREKAKEEPLKMDKNGLHVQGCHRSNFISDQKNMSWEGYIQCDGRPVIFQIATVQHTNIFYFLSKYPRDSSAVLPGT